ncbi:MAG: ATP-binding protein [Rhodoferax sp.]|uniref:ATP-binding protein n=1 Tax=Rhodoferax sp. TaxID=50421 RepID=UPI003BB6BDCB
MIRAGRLRSLSCGTARPLYVACGRGAYTPTGQDNAGVCRHPFGTGFDGIFRFDKSKHVTPTTTCFIIRLFIFADRVEIISPGHLPDSLTPEQIRTGTSNCRNKVKCSFLRLNCRAYASHR